MCCNTFCFASVVVELWVGVRVELGVEEGEELTVGKEVGLDSVV